RYPGSGHAPPGTPSDSRHAPARPSLPPAPKPTIRRHVRCALRHARCAIRSQEPATAAVGGASRSHQRGSPHAGRLVSVRAVRIDAPRVTHPA
ncbi:MAG: hypothetical protein M3Y74_22440, partial [Chloroflexota bacterium]|nr:hypothetical protein [Chloroflexota bacterium]